MEKKICDFSDNEKEIVAIREEVFVMEQNVPKELEIDGLDPKCKHVLIFSDKKPAATGRIQQDGHIGRVAVLKKYRGQGLGKEVIESLEKWARDSNMQRVYLGAQIQAFAFYHKLGFKEYGEVFLDAGIEHINMEKRI